MVLFALWPACSAETIATQILSFGADYTECQLDLDALPHGRLVGVKLLEAKMSVISTGLKGWALHSDSFETASSLFRPWEHISESS